MRSRWLSCLLVVAATACGGGEEDVGPTFPASPGGTGGPGGPGGLAVDSGMAVTPPGATPGGTGPTLGGTATPGAAAGGAAAGGAAGGSGATGKGLPCDVEKILKDKCQTCHGEPLMSGPMRLMTWADLQAASTAKPGEKIWQRVKARINDTAMPMPPAARPPLTAAEKTTLNDYLNAGAQQSTTTCTDASPTPGGDAGTMPVTPGSPVVNWDTDCDYKQDLLAHGGQGANDTTPYNVTSSGDSYEIFWFAPAWNEKVHVIDIQPVIDNGAVLHHWLLYMKERGTEAPGSHNPDIGLQSSDSALLSGWAPGNKSFVFPADVGMQVVQGSSARFGIELHYNTNANPPNRKDRSGARVCATKKLRPKEAATHWLGTQAIIGLFGGKFDAVGTCNVPKESHIIAHSPHMHKAGRYMKTIITKKDGSKVKVTDQPFAFDDQQIFPVDSPTGEIVVQPGDVITTTCSYESTGPITFGPGTSDEMCYNFVVAWPVGSLSTGAGIVGGKNTCISGI